MNVFGSFKPPGGRVCYRVVSYISKDLGGYRTFRSSNLSGYYSPNTALIRFRHSEPFNY